MKKQPDLPDQRLNMKCEVLKVKNDGTNFFRYAVAVAVACSAEDKPAGEVTQDQAASYIRSVLDLVFCYSGIEFSVQPMVYPKCGKIPLIIRLYGIDEALLWYYPNMTHGDLAMELESLLQGMLRAVPSMTA